MKKLFTKSLAAMLIAGLLLTPVAMMESEPEIVNIPDEIVSEDYEEDVDSVCDAELNEGDFDLVFEADLQPVAESAEATPLFEGETQQQYDNVTNPELVVSSSTVQRVVFYDNPNLQKLTISNCPNLVEIHFECPQPNLTSLTITDCPNVERMFGPAAALTSLDVSSLANLKYLKVDNNQLTSLDLSKNAKLEYVYCEHNKLTVLDLTGTAIASQVAASDVTDAEDEGNIFQGLVHDGEWWRVTCDRGIDVLPGHVKATPTPDPTPTPTPEPTPEPTPTPEPVISATTKSVKATVTAAPGETIKLDLGENTGKKFKSSNTKIATVDKNGNIKFKKAGKVKITYKVGNKTRTVTLTVKDPTIPTYVQLNPETTAVKKGDSVTLTPVIADGTKSTFTWSASNKKVATVNKYGVVKFKKAGKVTITCTAKRGGKKAKVTFTVSK